jgi:tetratricopeptide (TPR) repeat protein
MPAVIQKKISAAAVSPSGIAQLPAGRKKIPPAEETQHGHNKANAQTADQRRHEDRREQRDERHRVQRRARRTAQRKAGREHRQAGGVAKPWVRADRAQALGNAIRHSFPHARCFDAATLTSMSGVGRTVVGGVQIDAFQSAGWRVLRLRDPPSLKIRRTSASAGWTGLYGAERYDRRLEDVFEMQDEAARTIVAILAAHVNKAEIERTLNKPPETWQAYDYYLRAADAHASFLSSYKAAELYEVRRLLERSIAIDPNYARAYARLSWTHLQAWLISLDSDYLNPLALDRAYQLACKAVQLNPNLPQAHAHLGHVLPHRREHEAAVAEFEKAIALNPNFTDWRFGEVLVWAGDPARAIEAVERHMRLDPFYAPLAPGYLGLAHYMRKQYSQALPLLRECVSRTPNLRAAHCWLGATYAQLGSIEKARAEAAEVLRIDPNWTIEGAGAQLSIFKRTEDAEHYFGGLRKAGLPER